MSILAIIVTKLFCQRTPIDRAFEKHVREQEIEKEGYNVKEAVALLGFKSFTDVLTEEEKALPKKQHRALGEERVKWLANQARALTKHGGPSDLTTNRIPSWIEGGFLSRAIGLIKMEPGEAVVDEVKYCREKLTFRDGSEHDILRGYQSSVLEFNDVPATEKPFFPARDRDSLEKFLCWEPVRGKEEAFEKEVDRYEALLKKGLPLLPLVYREKGKVYLKATDHIINQDCLGYKPGLMKVATVVKVARFLFNSFEAFKEQGLYYNLYSENTLFLNLDEDQQPIDFHLVDISQAAPFSQALPFSDCSKTGRVPEFKLLRSKGSKTLKSTDASEIYKIARVINEVWQLVIFRKKRELQTETGKLLDSFVESCLSENPKERPRFKQVKLKLAELESCLEREEKAKAEKLRAKNKLVTARV